MPAKPSAVIDTRVIYCGDNLDQLRKLPDGCVDLIYIAPPFNSNRNYEVFPNNHQRPAPFASHFGPPVRPGPGCNYLQYR